MEQHGTPISREYLLAGSPSGLYRENMGRTQVSSAAIVIGATGLMTSVGIPLQPGDIITSITFRSGTQAAVTPTAWWFALYSAAATPALLAQTADQTTGAWAASTTKTVALSAPQLITAPGTYYAAISMTAGTIINAAGMILPHLDFSTGLLTTEKFLSATSGTALGGVAPATIATPTKIVGVPYVLVS
jgi:hypothetical protein